MALQKLKVNLKYLYQIGLVFCIVTIFFTFLWKPSGYLYPESMKLSVSSTGHSSFGLLKAGFGQRKTRYSFHSFDLNPHTLQADPMSAKSDKQRTVKMQNNLSGIFWISTNNKSIWEKPVGDNLVFKLGKNMYGAGCPPNPYRTVLKNLLRYWVNLSNGHNINTFTCGGSLLGVHRNGDIIPYDRDIDLCMSHKEFYKLQPLESRKPFNYRDHRIHIALQKDFSKDASDRIRVDCWGNEVRKMNDPCSFVTPWARVIFKRHYIDIFVFRESERYLNDSEYKTMHLVEDVFPLKPCMFMGIQIKCPKNPTTFLSRYYEADFATKPQYFCRNRTWTPTNPQVKNKFEIWFP